MPFDSLARSLALPGNKRNSEHPSDRHADPFAAILARQCHTHWSRRQAWAPGDSIIPGRIPGFQPIPFDQIGLVRDAYRPSR
ncbi:MAG TPA: hypothetical protein VMY42_25110 [Thermoguttaceae bacterium]|nr:hypothetical protein [Thermoguttaceae bacterium]